MSIESGISQWVQVGHTNLLCWATKTVSLFESITFYWFIFVPKHRNWNYSFHLAKKPIQKIKFWLLNWQHWTQDVVQGDKSCRGHFELPHWAARKQPFNFPANQKLNIANLPFFWLQSCCSLLTFCAWHGCQSKCGTRETLTDVFVIIILIVFIYACCFVVVVFCCFGQISSVGKILNQVNQVTIFSVI